MPIPIFILDFLWHEGANDHAPFATYLPGIPAAACRDFKGRIELLKSGEITKLNGERYAAYVWSGGNKELAS